MRPKYLRVPFQVIFFLTQSFLLIETLKLSSSSATVNEVTERRRKKKSNTQGLRSSSSPYRQRKFLTCPLWRRNVCTALSRLSAEGSLHKLAGATTTGVCFLQPSSPKDNNADCQRENRHSDSPLFRQLLL